MISISPVARLILGLAIAMVSFASHAAGDPARGKQLAAQCFACHGVDGNSPSPVNPKIGGQHEAYLLLALNAYVEGTRPNSLMTGAVLDKSEQDLRDIAAYFASQSPASTLAAGAPGTQSGKGAGGPRGGRPAPVGFDRGERDAEFTGMLIRVESLAAASEPAARKACKGFGKGSGDTDGDGLADQYDAEPQDAAEFAADTNRDGRFEICHVQQLQAIESLGTAEGTSTDLAIEARRSRSYQLAADLDATGMAFEPIGNCGPTGNCMRALGEFGFAGTFDGQGHVIRNLNIVADARGGVGLFGVLAETGVVMNLRLENVSVSGRAGVGSVVGSNFGVVYRCESAGGISGAMAIGGLVGGSAGLVYDSSFVGQVVGKQAVGGLVGDMTGAVYKSYTSGTITGTRGIGGLVGLNTFGSIRDSYSSMGVAGSNDIGGLVGVNTDAKVRNSYATGKVTGDSNNIGGLAGFNSQSSLRNVYATGDVSGADAVGGLIGRNKGFVANGFASGSVASEGQAAAIIGILVDGSVVGTLSAGSESASDIALATGDSTAWAPETLPAGKPLQYFCDANGNGFIDTEEWSRENYIWDFGSARDAPAIRCAAGGLAAQR
jgi:cytochrome c553